MASLNILAAAITTTFVVSSTLALPPNKLNSETPTSSSAFLQNPPLSELSPYSELPPDVAPLFPSTGGAAYSPAGSIMPTIPSSRSPPNPDITGLDTAFGPSGSLQDSSAVAQVLVKELRVDAFPSFLAFWLVLLFIM